jgi:hypothetical protein
MWMICARSGWRPVAAREAGKPWLGARCLLTDGALQKACGIRSATPSKEKSIPVAATLQQTLLASYIQPKMITDCYMLIEQEISETSRVSGTAVKLACKPVNTFLPGHIRHMVEDLLPQMVDKLEPYWADFNTSGGSEFGDYLAKRGKEVRTPCSP